MVSNFYQNADKLLIFFNGKFLFIRIKIYNSGIFWFSDFRRLYDIMVEVSEGRVEEYKGSFRYLILSTVESIFNSSYNKYFITYLFELLDTWNRKKWNCIYRILFMLNGLSNISPPAAEEVNALITKSIDTGVRFSILSWIFVEFRNPH